MSLIPMTHNDLCLVAVKWLKRANSAGGPGCHVAVSECRSGWTGEIPDAIGFRAAGFDDGSTVVECKTSRADFLADRKKAHRSAGGLGNWRYFMAPAGLIKPDELPAGWGLLEVNSRGHVKVVAGLAAYYGTSYDTVREQTLTWRHEADRDREQFLLVKLLHRVGDVEVMNRNLKLAYGEQQRLAKRVNELNEQIRNERLDRYVRRSA
ncbi:adenylosuccinate synthase [Stutzerimonas nitrititolerans]|uniref:Adenylosuccinate synthase n=1 Tax=Stutzerimonas nitrititolerans TaxID=2482751 RepID=A0ABX9UTV0_9GAMM|nr:adenylosuccinate synthase [Stutzerimonas nitrititolerans]RMH96415.1 adenylosuccinate synthase [Stutzerimonas nitrititolerans]